MVIFYSTFAPSYEKSMYISFDCDTTCPTLSRRRDFSSRFAQAFFNLIRDSRIPPLFSDNYHFIHTR